MLDIIFLILLTCRTPGRYFMRNTIPKLSSPNTREISLEMTVLVFSLISTLQPSWRRSVMNTADRLLRPLLTVLRAPLKTPATKRPGSPGMSPTICITNSGNI